MDFYTNVSVRGGSVLYRGWRDGRRVQQKIPFHPVLYTKSNKTDSEFTTIHGMPVEAIPFDTVHEARQFIDRYKDVKGYEVYGTTNFVCQYLYKEFPSEVEYDFAALRIANLDIETSCDGGFPSVASPTERIIAITTSMGGKTHVYGVGKFYVQGDGVEYYAFDNEKDLLLCFVELWKTLDPDIVTGWNIRFFDIPYLVARMNFLEEGWANSLSPWKKLREIEIFRMGKDHIVYNIEGISTLDYIELYQKFTYVNQESYSLNNISKVELGEEKMSYAEYETLQDFYTKNFQKFMEYNMKDVVLVDKLEEKLKLLELAVAMAYSAKVNLEDIFSQVKTWDSIIHNHLMSKGMVVPQKKSSDKDEAYAGAYVKDPLVGMHDWVVSYDLASLYPHLIMQYNLSPETKSENKSYSRGKIGPDCILQNNRGIVTKNSIDPVEYLKTAKTDNLSIAANGVAYIKTKQGFLPELMDKMYEERKQFKKLMIDAQKRLEELPTNSPTSTRKGIEYEISKYKNFQLCRKIQLNSCYGACGNKYFRFFDVELAEAITLSGQLSIQWIADALNKLLNRILKTENEDYVIASDTDSVYLRLGSVVKHTCKPTQSPEEIVDFLNKFCERVIQPCIEKEFTLLADSMNAFSNKMVMGREVIAQKGVWTAKKRYMLSVWDSEGVRYHSPKIKIMGIETARSSTPAFVRGALKQAVEIILSGDESILQKFIKKTNKVFGGLSAEEIAFPRSVSRLDHYKDAKIRYKKGTPIAVKAALLHNGFVKSLNIGRKYREIEEGEKMKFVHLKIPNTIGDAVIGFTTTLPPEFDAHKYIDYDMHFEKSFINPIETITNAIGWTAQERASLDSLFV